MINYIYSIGICLGFTLTVHSEKKLEKRNTKFQILFNGQKKKITF